MMVELTLRESTTLRLLPRHADKDKDEGVDGDWSVGQTWVALKRRHGVVDLQETMRILCSLETKGYIKLRWDADNFLDTFFFLTGDGKDYVGPTFEAYYGTELLRKE